MYDKRIDLKGNWSIREGREEFAHLVERETAAPVLLKEGVEVLRADSARGKKNETDTLTLQEALPFLEASRGDRFEALNILAVFTGMRPGELLALRDGRTSPWTAAQLTARVRRSLPWSPDGPVFKGTKTEKGRSVSLLPEAVEALKGHRVRQAEERLRYAGIWEDEGLVFPSAIGRPMRRPDLVKRRFKPVLKKSGIPPSASTTSGTPSQPSCSNKASTPESYRRSSATPPSPKP